MEVEATQAGIETALQRWSKLRRKKARIEAERDQAIAPYKARFEQRCAPFVAVAEGKLAPIEEEIRALENEITRIILKTDKRGKHVLPRVTCETAAAEVVVSREERELDPEAFFKSLPQSQWDETFWACFKVFISKAEKLIGANRVNELATVKRSHRVQISEL